MPFTRLEDNKISSYDRPEELRFLIERFYSMKKTQEIFVYNDYIMIYDYYIIDALALGE